MERPYKTLAARATRETEKVKGSRFIATGFPFGGEEALATEIDRLREQYPDANHHCWAWRDGDRYRYGDDGEPSGSAGKPMLQQIDGRGLDRVAVVVTRIFGGTKLGVGGLIRAYGGAAGALLDAAPVVEHVPYRIVRVVLPYALTGAVAGVVASFELEAEASEFGETVVQTFHVDLQRAEAFATALRERTAGKAEVSVEKPD